MTSCELKRWSSDFPPSKTRVAHTRNFPPKERDLVLSCARAIVTFHIGLHEMCVRTGVLYVITKFSEEDSLPNFLTHGAPLRARFARARSSAITCHKVSKIQSQSLSIDVVLVGRRWVEYNADRTEISCKLPGFFIKTLICS